MPRLNRTSPVTGYNQTGQIKRSDLPAATPTASSNGQYDRHAGSVNLDVPGVVELQPDQVLFLQGEPSDKAYFIEAGEIDIMVSSMGPDKRVCTLKTGEIIGEMGVIDNDFRSASAVARTRARVRVIDRKTIADMMNSATPGVKALLKSMMQRLRDSNDKLSGNKR